MTGTLLLELDELGEVEEVEPARLDVLEAADVGATTDADESRLVPATRVLPFTGIVGYRFPSTDCSAMLPHMSSITRATCEAR